MIHNRAEATAHVLATLAPAEREGTITPDTFDVPAIVSDLYRAAYATWNVDLVEAETYWLLVEGHAHDTTNARRRDIVRAIIAYESEDMGPQLGDDEVRAMTRAKWQRRRAATSTPPSVVIP